MALKRPERPLPDDVRQALELSALVAAFEARPISQRNHYLAWIDESRREVTRRKRLRQMLDELDAGDVFLKNPWSNSCQRPTKR